MNLKDLDLKDFVKIAVAVTATLILTLNFAISIQNTTIINNYVKETEKNFEETNQTLSKVQENVTKIKTDQVKELSLQRQILREVD